MLFSAFVAFSTSLSSFCCRDFCIPRRVSRLAVNCMCFCILTMNLKGEELFLDGCNLTNGTLFRKNVKNESEKIGVRHGR